MEDEADARIYEDGVGAAAALAYSFWLFEVGYWISACS